LISILDRLVRERERERERGRERKREREIKKKKISIIYNSFAKQVIMYGCNKNK